MQRDLTRLTTQTFDLVVIGGGIYGACVAWDAVLRGCSVALLEQGDFGEATSANSQKIVHGGFRYLQHADWRRMRESIRERRTLLRVAPHLVQPLPILLPTYRWGLERRGLLRMALVLYDLIAWDRNRGLQEPGRRIPRSRILSREACLRLAPGLDPKGLTGGAVWHDGQIRNTERLTLAVIRSAVSRGARVANYLRVTGLSQDGRRVTGVTATDRLTGRALEVRGRVVVNTTGPWVDRLVGGGTAWRVPLTKTISLVTRAITQGQAVSVAHAGRRFFLTPWRGWDIVGSAHLPFEGDPSDCRVSREEIDQLLADINAAYPGARLSPDDVRFVLVGLLPRETASSSPERLARRYQLRDHARTDGREGLLSIVGLKYTTARDVAERAVGLALRKLGRRPGRAPSRSTPVAGGQVTDLAALLAEVVRRRRWALADDVLQQLVRTYGADYPLVLQLAAERPGWSERLAEDRPVIAAQVIYAIRQEMAHTLGDVVFRRTELGAAGHPGVALAACAQVMAEEMGWDRARMEQELAAVEVRFPRAPLALAGAGAAA